MTKAAIDNRIHDAIASGPVAMSLSGGKDSTAAAFTANAILDAAGHPRSRRIAVHADLGSAEWRETPTTVEAVAAALDLPLFVVRQTRHDLVGRWHDRFERGLARYAALETLCLVGPWSSARLSFCTSEAKSAVITRFLKSSSQAGGNFDDRHSLGREPGPPARIGLGQRYATDVSCGHARLDLAPPHRLVGGRRLRTPRPGAAAAAHCLYPVREHAVVADRTAGLASKILKGLAAQLHGEISGPARTAPQPEYGSRL